MGYGLKVISDDGVTVIIDGTSNVPKIVTTGTLSLTQADGTGGTTTTSFPSIAMTTPPIILSGVSFSNGTFSNVRQQSREFEFITAWADAAHTNVVNAVNADASLGAYLIDSSPDYPGVQLGVTNYSGVSKTAYARFHLCKESAL